MRGRGTSRRGQIGLGLVTLVLFAATSRPVAAAPAPQQVPPLAAAQDEVPNGPCGSAPGVIGDVCDGVGGVISDGVGAFVGSGANAVLSAMVSFVVDGAGWLLDRLATFIEASTSPDLRSGWFRAAYGDMAVIGMIGLLPFLLLALLQGLIRQDAMLMLRSAFGYVPLAALGTAGAIVVVDLLVQVTDQLSSWVARGLGSDLSSFATGVGTALARIAAPTGGAVAGLAALIGAAVVAFAAFAIWLELLLRQAAIYVAVLFFPLGFMAMVWPATAHWVRRLTQGLVAIILSKFVIVAVMAMAASALDADVADEGFSVVVSGGALLGLAALAPYVLLRLIPVFDTGMSSQLEGTFRRPTAAVGTPATGSRVTGLIRQHVGGRGGSVSAPNVDAQTSGVSGTAATRTGGAGGAAGGAATAGMVAAGAVSAARGATGAARKHTAGVGQVASGSNGSRPATSTSNRSTATPTASNGSTGPKTPGPTKEDG